MKFFKNNILCKSCFKSTTCKVGLPICSLDPTVKYEGIKYKCPCCDCLVKFICGEICDRFIQYCDNIKKINKIFIYYDYDHTPLRIVKELKNETTKNK